MVADSRSRRLAPEVTVEAPIFEGVRLDRHMQPNLWVNQWANFWDYGFLALNGEKTGAVGLWCQDRELKVYKTLFYLINEQGLSLSVQAMNLPPFNELKSAKSMTWRLQAFDKSWAQAAARFRDWRVKNVKIAPRPDWVRKLSFMEYGMDKASPVNETAMLEKYFGGKDLDRVLTWAPAVRGAGIRPEPREQRPLSGLPRGHEGLEGEATQIDGLPATHDHVGAGPEDRPASGRPSSSPPWPTPARLSARTWIRWTSVTISTTSAVRNGSAGSWIG